MNEKGRAGGRQADRQADTAGRQAGMRNYLVGLWQLSHPGQALDCACRDGITGEMGLIHLLTRDEEGREGRKRRCR